MSQDLNIDAVLVERINSICHHLFDRWCERRSVVQLCYLMHCWPMSEAGLPAVSRIGDTMRELKGSCDKLDDTSARELRDLTDCVAALMLLPETNPLEVSNPMHR